MNKLIILHYINVSGMSHSRVQQTMASYIETYKGHIEGAIEYFLPQSAETRLEFYSLDNLDKLTCEKLQKLQSEISTK